MKRKLSRKGLIKKLDAAASKKRREIDGHKCVKCGRITGLQSHHWLIRKARSMATRWAMDNLITLCYYCHIIQIHGYSDKSFMDEFFKIMNDLVSEERQQELEEIAARPVKLDISDLELKLSELNGK